MKVNNGNKVVSIDIGGDKLMAAFYRIREDILQRTTEVIVRQGGEVSEHVAVLEELADTARRANIPVGISFAGPTAGTKLVAAPNLPGLFAYLRDRHNGDFSNLFSSVILANDAETGLIAASLEAIKREPRVRNIIYVINGSGLGGAVLKDTTVFISESGHIQVEAGLNRFNQRKPQRQRLSRRWSHRRCDDGTRGASAHWVRTWLTAATSAPRASLSPPYRPCPETARPAALHRGKVPWQVRPGEDRLTV